MKRRARVCALAALALAALAACSGAPTPQPTPHNSTTAPVSQPPAATATPSLATCPAARSFGSLPVLARVGGADDLATAPDGSLWVSDAAAHLEHLDAAGGVIGRLSDPRAPEGIVPLSDGTLVVAEQGPDRVVVLQPATGRETTLVQLTPRVGVEGLDGIGRDASTGDLLVPDSPNGTLLEVVPGTGAFTRLASGLGRPVDAAVAPGGGIVVTAENPAGLLSLPRAGGAATQLGSVADADDLVSLGGLLYVTLLDAGQVRAVDPSTGASTALVTGVSAPQGLAPLAGGRLAVADSTTGVVATLAAC